MKFIFYLMSLLSILSCGPKRMVSGYYDFPIECINSSNPNEIIVIVFSSGPNRMTAKNNARIQALNAVLFGPEKQSPSCLFKPLFNSLQKERYKDYFSKLLNDDSFVMKVTNLNDERLANKVFRDISKSRKQITESFVITVRKDLIERKMLIDEIK